LQKEIKVDVSNTKRGEALVTIPKVGIVTKASPRFVLLTSTQIDHYLTQIAERD